MTVVWLDISPKLRSSVEPLINKWLHILPQWVYRLVIRELDREGVNAEFTVDIPYRRCILCVGPSFLAASDPERVIVHEFCHAYTTPAAVPARQYLEDSSIAQTEQNAICGFITANEEGATEDLALLIQRLTA